MRKHPVMPVLQQLLALEGRAACHVHAAASIYRACRMFLLFLCYISQAEVHEVHNERPVNQWAARVTQGLIPIAVPAGYDFDLLLTNAVYFKGEPIPACC
jgi:hypothetical protein